MPRKNNSEGTAVKPNIQRQPCWPNQELRMNSSRRALRQIAHQKPIDDLRQQNADTMVS